MEIFRQCADEQSTGPLQTQINRTNLICGKCLSAGMLAAVTGRLTIVLLLLAGWTASAAATAEQLFANKVKPLLESRCVSCHGPDKVKGGLRMDSRAGLLKGGDSGPALVPGNPSESLLLQAV